MRLVYDIGSKHKSRALFAVVQWHGLTSSRPITEGWGWVTIYKGKSPL